MLIFITYLILLYILLWISFINHKLSVTDRDMFKFYKDNIKSNKKKENSHDI